MKTSKNAELLDDLLPQNIKADSIDKSSKMFLKSLAVDWWSTQGLTDVAKEAQKPSTINDPVQSYQFIANPTKEHEEKIQALTELQKRLEAAEHSLGVKFDADGNLDVLFINTRTLSQIILNF